MTQETPPETEKKALTLSVPAAILLGAAIIGIALLIALKPRGQTTPEPTQGSNTPPTTVPAAVATLRSDDVVRGDRNAEVVVIEYSDSDCPFCQQFHNTMRQVLTKYDGDVAWAYRHYPLSIHPNAYNEALALTCVGDLGGSTAFWSYLDVIMNITVEPTTEGAETLRTIALQNGVTADLYDSCVQNTATTARVDAQIAEAKAIGARGTPFSVAVNQKTGQQVVLPGAVPMENLVPLLDSLLQ